METTRSLLVLWVKNIPKHGPLKPAYAIHPLEANPDMSSLSGGRGLTRV